MFVNKKSLYALSDVWQTSIYYKTVSKVIKENNWEIAL